MFSKIGMFDFDTWWSRLMPFPFDVRMLNWKERYLEGTPHLDAQVSTPLLIVLYFLYRTYWNVWK